ncbi:ATP-binding protein [Zoogloea sp. LCSB751]|uniref:ATP-binding protein n=1 Tax=Zoogloea sp. LCSB751 TaxID=1965277 RepID=UPI0013747C36|nr:ATP-binding protein [Zoogloea sp. LCSB751]
MARSLRWLRLAIWVAFALLAALIVGVTTSLIRYDREQALRRSESELLNLTRVLEEHIARSFGEAEGAVNEVAGLVALRGGIDAFGPGELQTLLQQRIPNLPEAETLFIEREDGRLAVDAKGRELAGQDEAGADKVTMPPVLKDGFDIGSPGHHHVGSAVSTPLTRQIFDPAGKYLGTAGAAISHTYFGTVYRELGLSDQDTILVIHATRHVVLIHHPQNDALIGSAVTWPSALDATPNTRSLVQTGTSDSDPAERIRAYRRLADRPLIIGASRPVEDALSDFYVHRRYVVAAASLMLALLGSLAFSLHRVANLRDAEREALAELNASLEERVRQRTEELEQSNRELLSFSYSISHDLRAPLRAINGFAHALAEDYGERLDATGRDYIARLGRASLRMGELIDALLQLASVSRQALKIVPTDVSAISRDILDELATTAPQRLVQSHVEDELVIDADPTLIRNALQNLLGNAWKFSRDSRPAIIQVGGRPHGEEQLFYVTDNGIGFDMAHAGKLFEPFQQLHARSGFEGSGIGLASVRRIIERHGGTVWVESAPGAGTTVFFTLPRSPAIVRRPRAKPAN